MKQVLQAILILSLFSSCASYMEKMYRQLDKTSDVNERNEKDHFDQYRKKKKLNREDRITSLTNPYVEPSVKRVYKPDAKVRKRYKTNDIADSSGDGSLWSGVEGRGNYLFTNDNSKRNGDIVLIQVADKLKNEISAELKRAFPSKANIKPTAKEGAAKKEPASVAAEAPKKEGSKVTIHDRVSGVVIEEINKEHVLIRGRKNVLYNHRKRLVEVQALVAQRDIQDNDTINSDRIIETNINIIR
jgi:flagellar L-ring protein precursor FlgH